MFIIMSYSRCHTGTFVKSFDLRLKSVDNRTTPKRWQPPTTSYLLMEGLFPKHHYLLIANKTRRDLNNNIASASLPRTIVARAVALHFPWCFAQRGWASWARALWRNIWKKKWRINIRQLHKMGLCSLFSFTVVTKLICIDKMQLRLSFSPKQNIVKLAKKTY